MTTGSPSALRRLADMAFENSGPMTEAAASLRNSRSGSPAPMRNPPPTGTAQGRIVTYFRDWSEYPLAIGVGLGGLVFGAGLTILFGFGMTEGYPAIASGAIIAGESGLGLWRVRVLKPLQGQESLITEQANQIDTQKTLLDEQTKLNEEQHEQLVAVTAQNEKLRANIKNFEALIEQMTTLLSKTQEDLSTKVSELKDLTDQLKLTKEQIDRLQGEIADIHTNNEALKATNTQLCDQVSLLTQLEAKTSKDAKERLDQLTQLQEEQTTLTEELERLRGLLVKSIEDSTVAMSKQIKSIARANTTISSQIASLSALEAKLQADTVEVPKELLNVLNEIKAQIAILDALYQKINAHSQQLDERLASLKTVNEDLLRTSHDIDKEEDTIREQADRLELLVGRLTPLIEANSPNPVRKEPAIGPSFSFEPPH